MIKSLLISNFPLAFVLTKISEEKSLFFSFDPLNFAENPIWSLFIGGKNTNLGIIFGNNDKIIYAYNKHEDIIKVTRIEDNTSPKITWTYGF